MMRILPAFLLVLPACWAIAFPARAEAVRFGVAAPHCHQPSHAAAAMQGPPSVYYLPYSTHSAQGVGLPRRTYAYGWFGAPRRHHRGVHHGYYENYTQWSFR